MSSYIEQGDIGKWGRKPIDSVSRFISNLNHTGMMESKQGAFKDWQMLSKLYNIVNKPLPTGQEFNLSQFNKAYELRSNTYINGESEMKISEESFKNCDEGSVCSDVTGFSSAKIQMATKRSNEISHHTTQVPKRVKEKSNQSNINSFFKSTPSVHTSLSRMNVNSGLSKAYRVPIIEKSVSNKAPTISKIEITKPKSNKAPPYIPVRKVPSYMLNRRKNVNN